MNTENNTALMACFEKTDLVIELEGLKVSPYVLKMTTMLHTEVVEEAKKLGIYHEFSKAIEKELEEKLIGTPFSPIGGSVHYSMVPIKNDTKEAYCCYDVWHSSSGNAVEYRPIPEAQEWGGDSVKENSMAFVFLCK